MLVMLVGVVWFFCPKHSLATGQELSGIVSLPQLQETVKAPEQNLLDIWDEIQLRLWVKLDGLIGDLPLKWIFLFISTWQDL